MKDGNELRTASKYPFPTTPREARGKSGLVRRFIVAKSDLVMFGTRACSGILARLAYITIYPMHDVVRRKVGYLRIDFCEQIGE